MSSSAGSRFGPYELVEPIGAGGMGEVWRATDTNLKRDVAVKLLPDAFVADADRLARFQREAEMLAALNHPNIAQVYGLEKADGQMAIVMELIEGPTLADRIKDGPIPPDEALGIAQQVAAALEAAHARQIVHRDLKPANIKLMQDGAVKVLDFGISKPIDPSAISGGSPVMTTPAVTQTGVILGTAAYMSPEQARGRFVDQRSDIWAFGCLLFEMLTGQPAFGGEDVMLTLARVLDRDANLNSIPAAISPAVRQAIGVCLQKDPGKRFADVRDVRLALQGAFESDFSVTERAALAYPLWRRVLPVGLSAVIAALVVAFLASQLWPEPETPLLTKYTIEIPDGAGFYNAPTVPVTAISPRGDLIAFAAGGTIFLRPSGQLEAQAMPQTAGEAPRNLVFSNDGEWLYYTSRDEVLRRIALEGGSPETIARITSTSGPSYTDDGRVLLSQGNRVVSVLGDGSTDPEILFEIEGRLLGHPTLLPGGRHILAGSAGIVVVLDLETQTLHELFAGVRPRYVESEHIVYFDGGNLIGRSFDLTALEGVAEPFGAPRDLESGIRQTGPQFSPLFEIGRNGSLIYIEPPPQLPAPKGLARVDSEGTIEPLAVPPLGYGSPAVSPDGRHLAFVQPGDDGLDIWLYAFDGQTAPSLLTSGGMNLLPVFRDENTVTFVSDRRDGRGGAFHVFDQSIAGGTPTLLVDPDARPFYNDAVWAPDGGLVFSSRAGPDGQALFIVELPDGEPRLLINRPGTHNGTSFSADGRCIAYARIVGNTGTIYVEPYPPDGSPPIPVSRDGESSYYPVWIRTEGSRRLLFQNRVTNVIESANFSESCRVTQSGGAVVELPSLPAEPYFDSIPGTDDILVRWEEGLTLEANSGPPRMVVIENFTELLRDF